MTIAIHISVEHPANVRDNYHFKCFSIIAAEQPEHHFIFIFDNPPDPELYLEPNCTPVILLPRLKNNLLRHYWYNFKIPSLLERYNANVFVTAGTNCSLRTNVPQCIVIESNLLNKKSGAYLKRFLPAFINKASRIIITNPLMIDKLLVNFNIPENKLLSAYEGIDHLPMFEYNQLQEWKEKNTGGDDFFAFIPEKDNSDKLITVLKAFSIFKKWQKSAMQLAVFVSPTQQSIISKEVSNYKYRDHVQIFASDQYKIVAASYAAFIIEKDIFPGMSLYAMKVSIPVVTPVNKPGGVLPGNIEIEFNQDSIAEKMMVLYKDEHLRKAFIDKGLETAQRYQWKNTADALWKACNAIAKL